MLVVHCCMRQPLTLISTSASRISSATASSTIYEMEGNSTKTSVTFYAPHFHNGNDSYSNSTGTGTSTWYYDKTGEHWYRFKVDFVYQPFEKLSTAAEWRRHAEWLREVGEKFKPYGIRAGYHNHQHELRQHFDGKTPLEYLYDAGLAMELDVGHVKLANDDPVAWLNRLKGRVPSIHAKPGGGCAVGGEGDANDWAAIFAAALQESGRLAAHQLRAFCNP